MSQLVTARTIGRRTEKKAETPDDNEGDEDADESSSSDDAADDQGGEASAGDPHLMTKKELQRTFKEHTENAQARCASYRCRCHCLRRSRAMPGEAGPEAS